MYTLPVGEVRPYFSFEGLAHRVTEAHVSDNAVLRHTSVANKWKSIHLLLHPGHNATQLHYNLTFQKEDGSEFTMSFTVAVDTREVPQANVSQSTSQEDNKELKTTPTPEPPFLFSDVPEDKQGPKIHKKLPDEVQAGIEVPPVNMSLLPADVQSELQKLEEKLQIGDITLKGFNLTKAELLKSYLTPSQNEPESQSHPAETQRKDKTGGVSTVTTLLPVPIDDDLKKDFAAAKHSSTDAPIMRLLTSKLRGSVPKVGGVRSPTEAAAAAVVGRRLQHFTSADRGFLPWERRKYFQKVLEVKGSISENCFNIRGPTGIYSRTSFLNSCQRSLSFIILSLSYCIFLCQFQEEERLQNELTYDSNPSATIRKLRDTFADSLRYVNKLLNGQFGFTSRKVPAHMPHMIDRLVMQELQDTCVFQNGPLCSTERKRKQLYMSLLF